MTDADVIAIKRRFADEDDDVFNPIDDAIFTPSVSATAPSLPTASSMTSTRWRALPHISLADWEKILADYRAKLAEKLGEYINGMVDDKTAIRAINKLGETMKPLKPRGRSRK